LIKGSWGQTQSINFKNIAKPLEMEKKLVVDKKRR
jgi:hypothetical protein